MKKIILLLMTVILPFFTGCVGVNRVQVKPDGTFTDNSWNVNKPQSPGPSRLNVSGGGGTMVPVQTSPAPVTYYNSGGGYGSGGYGSSGSAWGPQPGTWMPAGGGSWGSSSGSPGYNYPARFR